MWQLKEIDVKPVIIMWLIRIWIHEWRLENIIKGIFYEQHDLEKKEIKEEENRWLPLRTKK